MLGNMNADQQTPRISRTSGTLRAAPFVAVALCFLLPFFTASSCGSGRHTTATGVDIVMGNRLIAQQTEKPLFFADQVKLGPIGPDRDAQAVSQAAQPWAIAVLVLALLGSGLAVAPGRHRRVATAATAVASLVSMLLVGSAFHAPRQDISPGSGLILASIILFLTDVWEVGVLIRFGSPDRADESRWAAEGNVPG
jgi:hypothetical protein